MTCQVPSWILARVGMCAVLVLSLVLSICQRSDARVTDDALTGHTDDLAEANPLFVDFLHQQQIEKRGVKPFPKIIPDNGMFHFVLKDIAHELIQLLEKEGLALSDRQRNDIYSKVESIYDRSQSHPAMKSDLVAFAPKKPDYHLYTPDSVLASRMQEAREKRNFRRPHQQACASVQGQWQPMTFGTTQNQTRVKIYRGFQFLAGRCTSSTEGQSCRGVTASYGATRCTTTGTLVTALVCNRCNFQVDQTCSDMCPEGSGIADSNGVFYWDSIYIPTCCKCAYETHFR